MIEVRPVGDDIFFEVCIQQVPDHFTAFCQVCSAQVLGDDADEVAEDMTVHMNERHQWDPEACLHCGKKIEDTPRMIRMCDRCIREEPKGDQVP